MQMKPIIGITPDYDPRERRYKIHEDYIRAVKTVGGYPVLLFPEEGLPYLADGILLSGGGDIDPLLFGEEPLQESGEISPLRDSYELALCREALAQNIPLLGICRGMQVMNIAAGGSIYQDIQVQTTSDLKHSQQAPRHYGTHSIQLQPDTMLAQLFGTLTATVNSFHHQAVARLGTGFVASAVSRDGLAEAIEHTENSFACGVQWHPEAMHTAQQQQLFQSFINAAIQFQKSRR